MDGEEGGGGGVDYGGGQLEEKESSSIGRLAPIHNYACVCSGNGMQFSFFLFLLFFLSFS